MNEKVKYWMELAEYDLETAQAMLDTKRYLYVGFMCHQTIEKGFKAVIASKGLFPPKIHNLGTLADKANLTEYMTDEQIKFIVSINPLNIESRYPKYQDEINSMLTPEICRKIIDGTGEMFEWIKMHLK